MSQADPFSNLPDEEFIKSLQMGFMNFPTWRKYQASLPLAQRKALPEHCKAVLYRKPCQLLFEAVIHLLQPAELQAEVTRWFDSGALEKLSPKNLRVFPLQYLTREQLNKLQRNRLKVTSQMGIPLRIFTPEEISAAKHFLHKVITLVMEKRKRDIEEYRRFGCSEERLIETHAGHVTKGLSSMMDKLENSIKVDGIMIANDEERSYDWVIFNALTEKKMFSILPKHEETDPDPMFTGNCHSDKTDKHLLISFKCDKYGVPLEWWALIVDIIKSDDDGHGDFKHKIGNGHSSFSNFKLTFEALTRASAQFVAGDYQINPYGKSQSTFCLYPSLIYQPI